MNFRYLFFLLSMVCAEHTILYASKKHRFKPFKTKQLRAMEVNRELAQLDGFEKWPQRKRIIRSAIERRRINPDLLRINNGSKLITPLIECVLLQSSNKDLAYAEFLLKRGSDSCVAMNDHNYGMKDPLLRFAKTIEMAQLLVQYGAYKDSQVLGKFFWSRFERR